MGVAFVCLQYPAGNCSQMVLITISNHQKKQHLLSFCEPHLLYD